MDSRIALSPQAKLVFVNREGGTTTYTIQREIGRGSASIVYEASYETTTGDQKLYRIKECYPYKLGIRRAPDGGLIPDPEDAAEFAAYQKKFRSDFSKSNQLFYAEGMQGAFVDQLDVYSANNTSYIVSAFSSEKTLADYRPDSLKECILLVRQAACVISGIHRQNFLYLDIKPDNVLIEKGVTTRIQLFDFDSLLPVSYITDQKERNWSDMRIYYSKGFAPIELEMADIRHLGPYTDVYGIGAMLFYLLFGETPSAWDCEPDAVYDFSKMHYDSRGCDDRLFFVLTDFFRRALAAYYRDRYPDMEQVCERLGIIETYADPAIVRIIPAAVLRPAHVFGRAEELAQIDRLLADPDGRCLFITGMGGIGKSTLVRAYAVSRRACFDQILYMQFSGTMEQTISNDSNLLVTTMRQSDSLRYAERYFDRKMRRIREIISGRKVLLIIDDFTGEIDADTRTVLQAGWKVILIARQAPILQAANYLRIEAVTDRDALRQIFEVYLGRPVKPGETESIERIIDAVRGHTLVLELIAKQIAASRLTMQEAAALTEGCGFTKMAPGKVPYEKDSLTQSETIGRIIDALFAARALSEAQKAMLKAASLTGISGMEPAEFRKASGLESLESAEDMEELIRGGWLMREQDKLLMHPVIREAVGRWEWTDAESGAAVRLLDCFSDRIRSEATRCDRPKHRSESEPAAGSATAVGSAASAGSAAAAGSAATAGSAGAVEFENPHRDRPPDFDKLSAWLVQAEEILQQCRRDETVRAWAQYERLLYVTVLYMPRYRKDYILPEATRVLEETYDSFIRKGAAEIFANGAGKSPLPLMEVYREMVLVHADRGEAEAIEDLLAQAVKIAEAAEDPRVSALYYDMRGEYYDLLLDGAYDAGTPQEEAWHGRLLESVDRTIEYAARYADSDIHHLYANNLLTKATVLMRSGFALSDAAIREISVLLAQAERAIEEHTGPYAQVRLVYELVRGWYAALLCGDADAIEDALQKARSLSAQITPTDLDRIDQIRIPFANMFYEMGLCERAAEILQEGISLCEKHPHSEAYALKKQELKKHIQEVTGSPP